MEKQDFIQANSTLQTKSIQNTLTLLEDGATVPFIARYRKEMTGGLDEVEIALIRDLAKKYDEAIEHYSKGLLLDPENAVFYSNRRLYFSTFILILIQ
jgi:transcriptional accessory protein Tex/SPT6